MGRGLGKLQRRILEYADSKILLVHPSKHLTVLPYVDSAELAHELNADIDDISRALSSLERRRLLRLFPNDRKRDRSYGSLKLPPIEHLPEPKAIFKRQQLTVMPTVVVT
jgi:hypothetical protein